MARNIDNARRDFHVSRVARDHYQFEDSLFSNVGKVVLANFHAARVFAQRMNQKRDLVSFPEQSVRASQINAMGLIHELTHMVFRTYREQRNPTMLRDLLTVLGNQFGAEQLDKLLATFADEFPPLAVYRRETDVATYLRGATDDVPNREIVLEEVILLWLSNNNPAFAPFLELFDDARLERETPYMPLMSGIQTFFRRQPSFGGVGNDGAAGAGQTGEQSLLDVLMAPARAAPHSLEAQLEFIRQRWGSIVGRAIYRVLTSLDLMAEESKAIFQMFNPGGFTPGPTDLPTLRGAGGNVGGEPEIENFTADREWMPRLVLMAKNAYVWIDQLAQKYNCPVKTLADIPDEELDWLAHAGITGLWLIGLWERSVASKEIKQRMGNTDAVASAYSLYDYQIANALGGEAACNNLRERAWQRGIRMASDMVPNHVGIDGRWVTEHPDWFVSLDYPPFPSYSFNGPDLSHDERVGVFIEDHYYERTDASVVFKRVDRHTGSEKYVYHGNDGTVMPWNDTAQLNYLNPEVREAVIQTILHVARQFPIIRFDAAMTLAKRHFQRLWFPEPGTGASDIASRAEFGLTKADFDRLMPQEFWREVVDRAAVEAPDTLLLAEAFWMMESYFVRTLGMHRVYNSAFMHILRDEDNGKYRMLMKQTLEFDPEILKRYVNFMNNPDERTAIDQFGKGDKYFGVCTLMLTLPGLPMFGHGQIEGFAEKYGMEYQRAYWDEVPDQYLIERHEREIFPLVHKRYLFAEVEHFLLYDFYSADGSVNEDVFALSNRAGDERGLMIYLNKYANAAGWVRLSASYMDKHSRQLTQKILGEGLGLQAGGDRFTLFRDHASGMEYIRSSDELIERGLYIELGGYKCHVFIDFREVQDVTGQYRDIADYLNGRGVPSIEEALRETFLQPIHRPLRALLNAELFGRLTAAAQVALPPMPGDELVEALEPMIDMDEALSDEIIADGDLAEDMADATLTDRAFAEADLRADVAPEALSDEIADADEQVQVSHRTPQAMLFSEVEEKYATLLHEITTFAGVNGDEATLVRALRAEMQALISLPALERDLVTSDNPLSTATDDVAAYRRALASVSARLHEGDAVEWGTAWAWLFVHNLGKLTGAADFDQQGRSWMDEWLIGRIISEAVQDLGADEYAANIAVATVQQLVSHQRWDTALAAPAAPPARTNGTAASRSTVGASASDVTPASDAHTLVETLFAEGEAQRLLGVNRAQSVLWYNKEAFERFAAWLLFTTVTRATADVEAPADATMERVASAYHVIQQLTEASERSGYQVEKLLDLANTNVHV